MKTSLLSLTLVLVCAVGAPAAEQTWTGVISDSNCGAMHASGEHGTGKITDRECVIGREGDPNLPGCVSAKYGAKFVLVVDGKVYKISNQDYAGLRVHAAHTVRVTGELAGDTIKVASMVMPKP
jgi:hypothetical protein